MRLLLVRNVGDDAHWCMIRGPYDLGYSIAVWRQERLSQMARSPSSYGEKTMFSGVRKGRCMLCEVNECQLRQGRSATKETSVMI